MEGVDRGLSDVPELFHKENSDQQQETKEIK